MICLYINQKAHTAFNFNCLIETEGLRKVTGSHVHRKYGNILETVQDKEVIHDLLNSGHSDDLE